MVSLAEDSDTGIGVCGWILTIICWLLVLVTMPFSFFICFKVQKTFLPLNISIFFLICIIIIIAIYLHVWYMWRYRADAWTRYIYSTFLNLKTIIYITHIYIYRLWYDNIWCCCCYVVSRRKVKQMLIRSLLHLKYGTRILNRYFYIHT